MSVNTANEILMVSRTEEYFFRIQLSEEEVDVNVTVRVMMVMGETYASRVSTRAIPSISILLIHCPQRTMLPSLYGVPSRQSHGSSKDSEERASVESLVVTGHL